MDQVQIEMALDKNYLVPDEIQKAYLMVKLTAPELVGTKRPKQNLSFVIDRSGSMHGDKLDHTKKAVAFAVGHLGNEDLCSVIAFDDEISVVVPQHKLEAKDVLKRQIQAICSGGTTNLSGGMLTGFKEVKKTFLETQINRILLLTDGMANVGITNHQALVKKAEEIAQSGVQVSTFGLGEEFEEDLLQQMAEAGKGNFYYIETPDQIPGIFEQELTGLLSIVAQNLVLTIKPSEEVRVTGILGYPATDETHHQVMMPDLYSGEIKVLLLELSIASLSKGYHSLFSVEVEYTDVRESLEIVRLTAAFGATCDSEGTMTLENKEVMKQVQLYKAADAKEEAIKRADRGDYEGSRQVLEASINALNPLAYETNDQELQAEIMELNSSLQFMSEDGYDKSLRKKMSSQAYQQRRGRKQ
jgi:Ca-activated chloride channel family protein